GATVAPEASTAGYSAASRVSLLFTRDGAHISRDGCNEPRRGGRTASDLWRNRRHKLSRRRRHAAFTSRHRSGVHGADELDVSRFPQSGAGELRRPGRYNAHSHQEFARTIENGNLQKPWKNSA